MPAVVKSSLVTPAEKPACRRVPTTASTVVTARSKSTRASPADGFTVAARTPRSRRRASSSNCAPCDAATLTSGRSGLRIPGPSDAPVVAEPKGRNVYVEGRLEYRSYKGRNRNEREASEIIAGDVQFLDSKMESKTPTAEAVNEVNPHPR